MISRGWNISIKDYIPCLWNRNSNSNLVEVGVKKSKFLSLSLSLSLSSVMPRQPVARTSVCISLTEETFGLTELVSYGTRYHVS